jgi:hypothetical protein
MAILSIYMSDATCETYRTMREKYIAKFSVEFGINPILLKAIIRHESQNNPHATRDDKAVLDNPKSWTAEVIRRYAIDTTNTDLVFASIGYPQMLWLTCMDMGYKEWAVARGLSWGPESLFCVETGIYWMCKYIKKRILNRYSKVEDIVSAYNQGNNGWFDLDKDGIKDANEKYKNQEYVDEVMRFYREYGGK